MKNAAGKAGVAMLVLISLISGGALFFEDQFTALASLLTNDKFSVIDTTGQVLKIAYLFEPADLDPFSAQSSVQSRLNDVYEPLVGLDENLNIYPVLAVYYGLLSENSWSIHLRQSVKFHDGSELDADDVLYSFEQAQKYPGIAEDLMESLQKIEKTDEKNILITTKKPDPLLLNKLSKLLIVPDGYTDYDTPVGTGSYKITDATDLSHIKYQRNELFWGKAPYFGQVEILSVLDKAERVNGLLDGDFDFLANVPPDNVDQIKEKQFMVAIMPSLEVGFVMFNQSDSFFSQRPARIAIAQALNKSGFLDLAFGYAKTINQFIPNGVFGYNPDVKGYDFDIIQASKQLEKVTSGFEKVDIQFFYPDSLKLLGQYFKEQLAELGMNVETIPMTDSKLQESFSKADLPFYYMGWRNDSGDALPFLKAVFHSKTSGGYGVYNGMNYANSEVDMLIESAENDFNMQNRLKSMQQAMKIAVEDDVVGIPLFETQSLFAYNPALYFTPRVDSLIYPSTIRQK